MGSTDQQIEQLGAWAEATEREIKELLASMAPLEEQLKAARERLDLIHRLLRLSEKGTSKNHGAAEKVWLAISSPKDGASHLPRQKVSDIEVHIERLLEGAGKPMHISDIRQALIDQGVPLPGRGDEANIIVRLRRASDRFSRTGRGMYGLPSWGLPEVKPTRKKLVRRRRARGPS
jgi:hypothetical protein